ncbi:replication protein P [Kushneria phosphatilytica]|uniref:Uncharacterized protein n=1 Tax=Kushneria phosphatilytica TaxID=657387 RepID=A0A1S1NZ22_9GAMM|nr:replication protein P [Kushneria phosphatilytica]OHV12982.1 hypothetical protein BH688_02985 [Kushneria phosphatilytica]QEL10852.1 hypothetical protein FY550_06750 [Kushneria phosphatilytica]
MAEDMDHLFDAMRSMFGNRFTSQWGAYDEGGVWLGELTHLTPRLLELGIGKLRARVRDAARSGDEAWPPQPLEFAALCEPTAEDLGMPSVDRAWREANGHAHDPEGHRWSHPAVRMAGQSIGWIEIHGTTAASRRERLEKRFAREYQALVNRVMAGEQLEARGLLENDNDRSPAELAKRAGEERAAAAASEYGHRMTGEQGIRSLRAALGGR